MVQDNLNTHKPASLYEAFPPEEAPSVPMKVIHFTPRNLHSRAPKDYLDHAHAPEAD
jgi:hypothetical protein